MYDLIIFGDNPDVLVNIFKAVNFIKNELLKFKELKVR